MSLRPGRILTDFELKQLADVLAESDDNSVFDDNIANFSYQLDKNAENCEASDADGSGEKTKRLVITIVVA